jgi:hypothetical protein
MSLRVTALVVFIIALAIRLVTLAYFLPKLKSDVDLDAYRSLARSLAQGRGFVAPGPGGEVLPQVDRTPVYPLFLAGLMKLGGDRLGLFLAAQCLVGALTCALTVLLAARWLTTRASALAGLLVALDPNSVVRCVDLRTETVFTLLVVAGAYALVWRSDKAWAWLLVGLIWSVATLCRPIAIGLWVVALFVVVLQRQGWLRFTVFVVGFVPLIVFWSARNHALTGRWFFSTAATYNLYVVRASGVQAERQEISQNEMQDRFAPRFLYVQCFKDRESFETGLRDCRRESREIFASAPGIAAKQFVLGWFKVLFGPGARSIENSLREPQQLGRIRPVAYAIGLAAMAVAAVIGACKLGRPAVLAPLLAVYFALLSGGGGGNSRFRTPITPMLATLAVAGYVERRKT